ncbi:MAG: excinuclease ABC subunit UvrC [Lachnospiraceae bacterium]|nr:excinuclease ABC subunit UvrC [Lachnospiraceae bacterium]
MFNIKEELDKLPKEPGVYLMHDKDDNIIYVGKAVNLFNRVRSYFRVMNNRTPKIERMISLIDHFEYIVVDSDLEAFVLENNLIKEYNPKYNTLLKDSKTYPYIKVSVTEDYPKISFVRRMGKDKSKYFGPYTSSAAVNDIIELLNNTYKFRTCNKACKEGEANDRPCLNFHMGKCLAPCSGKVSSADYKANINLAIDFMNGNDKALLRELKEKMEKASEEMDFEEAIKYRDLIESAKRIIERQKISDNTGFDDKDIIAQAHDETDAVVQVFFVRNGKMIGREHHHMDDIQGLSDEEILGEFVKRYYTGTPYIPPIIMLSADIPEQDMISSWLSNQRGGSCKLVIPKIGFKEKLVDLARNNAEIVLKKDKERIVLEEKKTKGALEELGKILGMEELNRLEAFDISNTNGFQNVGSMVVFEGGKPVKGDYRKFRIKSVEGPDDYSCMHEVLSRRFIHGFEEKKQLREKKMDERYGSFSRFPDLILMDGGKGQVNVALEVLSELGINIPVCGMVKDDNHHTRGLYVDGTEIPIDRHSESFKLITRVQDEAHRFAIEYHKSLREKKQVHSVFEDIPGIGPARRKALLRAFENVEEIKQASVETIAERAEIPEGVALEVYKYFH